MRAVLVFPPHASPTYAPLGVATLAAHLRAEVPACRLAVRDVNLTAWEFAAAGVAGGPELFDFLRGRRGDFFDRPAYGAEQPAWRRVEDALTRLGARVKLLLAAGEADPAVGALLDRQVAEILDTDPELVGFSLLSLGQLPWTLALAGRIRALQAPGPRVVLGGAACTAFRVDDLLAACPSVDGVVVGEGEAGLAALCRGADDREVPGLVTRGPAGLRRNRPAQTSSLRSVPAPDFGELPLDRYLNPAPVLPVLYSRGCKWRRCRFCAHNFSFAAYRTAGAGRCLDRLEELVRRHGARHFYFADLYVDAPDLERLADGILARGLDVNFHVLGRPSADYTRERLEKLARAGCRWISWGVESGSQRLLDLAAKGTSVPTVERVLGDARAAGISNLVMMIYGLPLSTDADLEATFRFLERVYPSADAMTASAFALFEGTPFARAAARFGLVPQGAEEEVRVAGAPVRSRRLRFREVADDGSLRPPRGPVEVGQWQRRRAWLGEVPFLEGVACEHYLLHVSPPGPGSARPPAAPERPAA